MSIREKLLKIKGVGERQEVFTILLIILVAFGSFGLGRLSKIADSRVPVVIRAEDGAIIGEIGPEGEVNSLGPNNTASVLIADQSGRVVASKSGAKYHFPWCSGALRISEANKIWFDSKVEAELAGYTPAANCKGL